MPKNKSVVLVDSAGGTDDELIELNGETSKYIQNGQKIKWDFVNNSKTFILLVFFYSSDKVNIKSIKEISDKELFLLKLPKELIKYQNENKNLKFNLNDIKCGNKITINDVVYEAVLSRSKVSFNCLCKTQDSFKAVNSFKYIVQVKRCIEMPEIIAPEIVHTKVEVPDTIENYLERKKTKETKNSISKSLKRVLEDELIELDKKLGKKSKKNKISKT